MPGLGFYVKDLRLVDKESGVFDKLSVRGMQDLYPEEWEERQRVGKFYHRPPGGESWLDVAIRVKAFMDSKLKFDSVLVFSHDVTILTAIFLSSEMTPEELLEFQRNTPVENGSVTSLTYKGVSNVENRGVGLVSR
jgi:broad specificity phosphatase PhoE